MAEMRIKPRCESLDIGAGFVHRSDQDAGADATCDQSTAVDDAASLADFQRAGAIR